MKLSDVTNLKPTPVLSLSEQQLDEINMSPSSLKQLASQINARAGMEFEMIVPGASEASDDGDMEPDWDSDESVSSIQDAVDFFHDGDFNGRREVQRLREQMSDDYQEWLGDGFGSRWDSDMDTFVYNYLRDNASAEEIAEILGYGEDADGYPDPDKQAYIDAANKVLEEGSGNDWYDQAYEDAFADFMNEDHESEWLEDRGLHTMQDVSNEYDVVSWPHYYNNSGGGEVSVDDAADSFSRAIGKPINSSERYHGARREAGHYVVEPDGSLEPDDDSDGGLEFVSPPMPIAELLTDLDKVAKWATNTGCYTNESTGLHINVSVEGWDGGDTTNLDYVKLALLLGDNYILEKFGRVGNTFCKSAMNEVKNRISQRPEDAAALLQKMKSGLDSIASKTIHSGITHKYTSINTRDGYIEFRSPGGDWLGEYKKDPGSITNTLLRFVVALDAAVDPEKYKQEYLKKLYAVLQPKAHNDTLAYFAQYAAGAMPKAALKSFVRQAQLERKGIKDTYNELKPTEAPTPATVAPAGGPGDYKIYRRADNSVVHTFQAGGNMQAQMKFDQWLEQMGGDRRGYAFARMDQTAATAPATEWTGQWLVKDAATGREIHRFGGVGNNQGDANRIAAQWARDNNRGGEIDVVPEMR